MSKVYPIDQMSLISAINTELTRQHPEMPLISSVFNKCIEAANLICEECEREKVMATERMSLSEWFNCDDTGLSSCFMAYVIDSGIPPQIPVQEYAYPRDADDLGRCIRMVRACELENQLFLLRTAGHEWSLISNQWDNLTSLYDQKQWEAINTFLTLISK
ncbi:hypothetical protein H5159_14955 [Pseudoalteromonas sp. SG43-1]|uniref:hypothetical protein n=1 Tax=Pseudoalteromonas sp. SG43-1 TaxID=2760971 RepID=UPI00160289F2|nr:hypothetical protein [Pseudoalteromonas sp. SG43-1]MBB1452343.1 hypothetical protein [Pseudoalteromonas sp. SG43-1]